MVISCNPIFPSYFTLPVYSHSDCFGVVLWHTDRLFRGFLEVPLESGLEKRKLAERILVGVISDTALSNVEGCYIREIATWHVRYHNMPCILTNLQTEIRRLPLKSSTLIHQCPIKTGCFYDVRFLGTKTPLFGDCGLSGIPADHTSSNPYHGRQGKPTIEP